MAYAVAFLILAGYLAGLAAWLGGWGWVLLWPAVSFALVAAAYAGVGPRVFGKRPDGTLRPVHLVALLPFLAFASGVWHVLRLTGGKPAWHEVAPGLYLGRRVFAGELPSGVGLVVDLTAEFVEPAAVRTGREYRSLPVLDALPPDEARFAALVAEVAAFPGPVYVHCARGHGRSGLFVAAVVLARGLAATPADAVKRVRGARPGVRLKKGQARLLERVAAKP